VVVLLFLLVLVVAGVFLYLRSSQAEGLGSGSHTLSTPTTIGGFAENSNSQLQSIGKTLQSELEANSNSTNHALQGTVVAFYGSTDGTGTGAAPDYFLFVASYSGSLTVSDLSRVDRSLLTVSSVQNEDGIAFHCGVPMAGAMGTMCTWVDGNVWGVVEGATSVGSAATLAAAEEARATAEH
jgi:hypothetical protein